MRDFNFPNVPRTALGDGASRPGESEDAVLRRFHSETQAQETQAQDEKSHSKAKIAGGILAGFLMLGGGLYAYEAVSRNTQAPQQQVALNAPASNRVAADPYPSSAPPTATPDNIPAPDGVLATTEPASQPSTATVQMIAETTDADVNASAADPINAPLTVTDMAPAPEQPGQMALQQPITAPLVSGQAIESLPAIASNDVPLVTAESPPQILTAQLPAEQAQEAAAQ